MISGTSPSNALGISSGTKGLVSGTAVEFLDLSSDETAAEAVKVLDATIAQISSLRADVGAVHSRLEYSSSYLLSDYGSIEESKFKIGGTDFALETANLVMAQLLQNSSLAVMTQANVEAATVARLLEDF